MTFNSLSDRMKDYEDAYRTRLMKKTPIIIRLDGVAFHTFTKGLDKPFDNVLMESMQETAKYLCQNIMNCKTAYTQSDEISLLLVDYEKQDTQQWFDNVVQKMVSVSASKATIAFNKSFTSKQKQYNPKLFDNKLMESLSYFDDILNSNRYPKGTMFKSDSSADKCSYFREIVGVNDKYNGELFRLLNPAIFDSRAFNIPKEEVCNYFIYRQQDAARNSIQAIAQSIFSHKELDKKNSNELQEMIFQKSGKNWNDYPITQKRGSCVIRKEYYFNGKTRNKWIIDNEIPIFTQNREYIDNYVFPKVGE